MNKATFPHCDSLILHAPGECKYCDMYPERQKERMDNGVNFTGHGDDPATEVRPLDTINKWGGNVPKEGKGIYIYKERILE